MLRLVPVVEPSLHGPPLDWALPAAGESWIALHGNVSDGDVARVVATLANYNRIAHDGSAQSAVKALERAPTLVAPGGLLIHVNGIDICPGCCCGLETWHEWRLVRPGGHSPWLGHDPSPSVECKEAHAVVWVDADAGDASPSIPVEYAEIDQALAEASIDISQFARRLSEWLGFNAPESAGFRQKFDNAFAVA